MKIIDLEKENEHLYFVCLEEWSEDMKEAGDHKKSWYSKMQDKGLRVKLAVDDSGVIGGMIQYAPIEHSFAEGEDLYVILCIWVHGHKQGRGDCRKRGMGKALIQTAEEDVRNMGKSGICAWGLSIPAFMRASWFKKQGYTVADKMGIQVLLWKPFTEEVQPPKWIKKKKNPVKNPGHVTVTCFKNGWCPVMNMAYERSKQASAELGDKVIFQEYNTFDRTVMGEWGISDALFIDCKSVRTGPPPSYQKIKKKIAKRVKKIKQ